MRKRKAYLIFIDTNIYLDFYRSQNDAELGLLYELHKIKDRIVSTYQVEMEFKKNRQQVIRHSLENLKIIEAISFPAFASKTRGVEVTKRINKELAERVKEFKAYLAKVMVEPKRYDRVYKACQEIFEHQSPLNLNRQNKKRYNIRRLAKKRFILGYPPRKSNDVSIGDAVNWEWIVDCCETERRDVVIVSRDGDYGIPFDNQNFLNDWLYEEFRNRISPQRKVILTSKLSEGLRRLDIPVSKEAEKAEKTLNARVRVLEVKPTRVDNVGMSDKFSRIKALEEGDTLSNYGMG